MKKKFLALLAALSLLLSLNLCAYADSTASAARNGVAVLATCAQVEGSDPELWESGSCFFIGKNGKDPQYLLTNYHVIQTYLEYGKGKIISTGEGALKMILRVYFSGNDYVEAYLVDYEEAQDVALLRLAEPTDKREPLKLQVPEDKLVGSQVYTIGYPGNADDIVFDPTTVWGINDSMVTKGTVGRLMIIGAEGTEWIQLADSDWSYGNSGGPLVTEKGTVVGIASGVYTDELNNICVAVNVESILPMLRNNGVEISLAGNGVPVWVFIAGGAALLVIVLVVLLIVLFKGGNNNNGGKNNNGGNTTGGKDPGVLVDPPITFPKKVASIRSMAAQHHGGRIRIDGPQILIGRDPSCKLLFREDTPGVSGVHCSVAWDAATNEFVLTDLKSTYGTFLATGMKLTPHVPCRLRNGDSFYLGDVNNTLRVEVE